MRIVAQGIGALALLTATATLSAQTHHCDAPGTSCSQCLSRVSEHTLFQWSGVAASETEGEEIPPLVSDRPDFTEASSTVGRGVVQLECGYTFFHDDEAGVETELHSWGEPLLRIGVLRDWLEFRIGAPPLTETQRSTLGRQSESGVGDLYLGAKLALTPQAGMRPEMALVPQMFVPTGSSAFTSDEVLPGLNWLYSWDLTEDVSLAGSTQFNRQRSDSGEGFTLWAQSVSLGMSLTERWGGYAEWFGFFPHSADEARTEHYFDGGFTYGLTPDLQWDIRAGVGLNDAAADFFAGTGLVLRFR
jgi:hypothetical protein